MINCTNNLQTTITTAPTVKLFGNFIFLDKDEKRNFSSKPQEYLIEQVQHINTTLTSSNELNFNHMVKELLWVCRSKNCDETDPTTGSTPVDAANNSTSNQMNKGNDYFDYSPNATTNEEYTLNAVGYEGKMVQGKAARETGDVFRSQAELVRAMSDRRYDSDPAYRQDVIEKLERSDNLSF